MTAEPTQPRFLTLAQAADELNVKQSLVQGLIRTGELRAFQVGGKGMWRIGRQDVEDYIAKAYQRTAEGLPPVNSRMGLRLATRSSQSGA